MNLHLGDIGFGKGPEGQEPLAQLEQELLTDSNLATRLFIIMDQKNREIKKAFSAQPLFIEIGSLEALAKVAEKFPGVRLQLCYVNHGSRRDKTVRCSWKIRIASLSNGCEVQDLAQIFESPNGSIIEGTDRSLTTVEETYLSIVMEAGRLPWTPRKILVVEDDCLGTEYNSFYYRTWIPRICPGCVITHVEYAELAIEQAHMHPFELIFLDHDLRGRLKGIESAPTLRRLLPETVIILNSAALHAEEVNALARSTFDADPRSIILNKKIRPGEIHRLWESFKQAGELTRS